jgi:uncharacterized membrane protein YagU involved in acid resistance
MHKAARGAIAGTIATIPMTLVMISLFRRLPADQRYPLPPRLIIESLRERSQMGPSMNETGATRTTLLAHFAYGAVTGALFPYLERGRGSDFFTGTVFGAGVWAASYLGWIPAANILTPATRHPARRNALMLTAHFVWGAALASVSAALRTTGRSQESMKRHTAPHGVDNLRTNKILLRGEVPFCREAETTGYRTGRHRLYPELSGNRRISPTTTKTQKGLLR